MRTGCRHPKLKRRRVALPSFPGTYGNMARRVPYPDDDALPVIVPRNDRPLVQTPSERIRRLREHLGRLFLSMRRAEPALMVQAGPNGFAARVANTACSLCRGWCCFNGADDAFLDETTLAREPPGLMSTAEVIEMYVERVPDVGYQDSCIFHGAKGCTLDRSMRSDVCNSYFCNGLHSFFSSVEEAGPTIVISGEFDRMRLSPVLVP
jgi:hypothetical protein